MTIEEISSENFTLSEKYSLQITSLDYTDNTLLCRLEFFQNVFIQVYFNIIKKKKSYALIVSSERIFGIDNLGGFIHKHPFEDPNKHIPIHDKDYSLEKFILESIQILKELQIL